MKKPIPYLMIIAVMLSLGTALPTSGQERIPREYTNPGEIVTFDRTTPFSRALDVINQFAQEYAGKVIIDRSGTEGNLGISVPPMHWQDALDLILQAKYLQLLEQPEFYEIVDSRARNTTSARAVSGRGAVPDTALSTNSKEVRINAIFFEGNRRALQEIGVDWSTLTENVPENVGSFVNSGGGGGGGGGNTGGGGGGSGGQLPSSGEGGFDGPFVSVNQTGAQSVSQNVFNSLVNFGDVFGSGIQVQALFSAFEADNLGEILASPTIKVLEGQEGRIQVGQDFSIKQRDFAGNVTDQFFSVGTILQVVPRVIEQEDTTFIHLDIEAERSSAQPDPVSTVINKQNATTQTLLLNKEATVIAGLYRTEVAEVRRGIPILKDLPPWFFGLRYLFGFNSKDYQTRELVILIQASIEPGIPERMGQERLADKYEVLERERQRMQREIERYRESEDEEGLPPAEAVDEDDEVLDEITNDNNVIESDNGDDKKDEVEAEEIKNEPVVRNEIPVREVRFREPERKADSSDVPNAISNRENSYSYYVVGGSFKSKVNAENYRYKLDREGYEAEILVNVEDGYYMVAYRGFEQRRPALQFLSQIKNNTNNGAWLYNNY